ncbi:MAG: FecR domain-containing protein [Bacteroidetes bacterium]|nr:FecR domain-containing protein [Bacteroidota bacterium]
MNEITARTLLDAYLAGLLSDTDREAFAALLDDPAYADWLSAQLKSSFADGRFLSEEPEDRKQRLTARIQAGIRAAEDAPTPVMHRVRFLRTAWFRYAAILILMAGTATVLYRAYHTAQPAIAIEKPPHASPDIPAGGNKAVLTLADGSRIVLDSAATGNLASQGSMEITKLDSGALAYRGTGTTKAIGLNTISTPKGGQYHVVLPDGSAVWLNAASSLTFPTAFGKERHVTMTGEAYFEIKKDAARPFLVKTEQGQTIDVLGTSFNVNTYRDEKFQKTTLLEGAIQVTINAVTKKPVPGEQVVLDMSLNNGTQTVQKADIVQTMAWKNGIFNMEGATLPEVMRQLSRWYDIEVVYEHGVPDISFGGKMERSLPLSGIVTALTNMGVHLRMEAGNKRLVILQ